MKSEMALKCFRKTKKSRQKSSKDMIEMAEIVSDKYRKHPDNVVKKYPEVLEKYPKDTRKRFLYQEIWKSWMFWIQETRYFLNVLTSRTPKINSPISWRFWLQEPKFSKFSQLKAWWLGAQPMFFLGSSCQNLRVLKKKRKSKGVVIEIFEQMHPP